MIIFSIKKADKEGQSDIILQTGHTAEFTVEQFKGEKSKLEKMEKELSSQIELEDAKIKNIQEHHPMILEMSEQDICTAALYNQSTVLRSKCIEKLGQVKEAQRIHEEDAAEIEKQTGISLAE